MLYVVYVQNNKLDNDEMKLVLCWNKIRIYFSVVSDFLIVFFKFNEYMNLT